MKCVGAEDGQKQCQRCKRANVESVSFFSPSFPFSLTHLCPRCVFEKHRRGRKPGSKYFFSIPTFDHHLYNILLDCPKLLKCFVVSKKVLIPPKSSQKLPRLITPMNSVTPPAKNHPTRPHPLNPHILLQRHTFNPTKCLHPTSSLTQSTIPLLVLVPVIPTWRTMMKIPTAATNLFSLQNSSG